jgi:hypothetical protein
MFDDPKVVIGLTLLFLYLLGTYIKIIADRWKEISLEIEKEIEDARLKELSKDKPSSENESQ